MVQGSLELEQQKIQESLKVAAGKRHFYLICLGQAGVHCKKFQKYLERRCLNITTNPRYAYQKQWRFINKEYIKKVRHQHYLTHKQQIKAYNNNWAKENPEKRKLINERHNKTDKKKISRIKSESKRRQHLNWIQLFKNPFDESEVIEWHHINDTYVIALPRDLHKLYGGKYHREKVMEIVKQIYL